MTDVGTRRISGTSTLRISDVVRYLLFISGIATLLEMVVHVEEKYFDVKVQVILSYVVCYPSICTGSTEMTSICNGFVMSHFGKSRANGWIRDNVRLMCRQTIN
jgi:hypothetical protein